MKVPIILGFLTFSIKELFLKCFPIKLKIIIDLYCVLHKIFLSFADK